MGDTSHGPESRVFSLAPARRPFVLLVAVSLALLGWFSSTSDAAGVSVNANSYVVHVPATTAYVGKPIAISARAECVDPKCSATVVYRETARSSTDAPAPWTRAALQASASDAAGYVPFEGAIPAAAVSTRGVDYYLEVVDGPNVHLEPLTAPGVPYHVHTVSPPIISHAPPVFSVADRDMPLELKGSCSTGNCTATIYFRTSPGGVKSGPGDRVYSTGSVEVSIGEHPETWDHVDMTSAEASSLGDAGRLHTWKASVPAKYVDTKGVDYVFKVDDGKTTTWSPGTTYQGYLPLDGTPVTAYHAHVVEPPRIAHVPPVSAAYREAIAIKGTATCPIERTCTARLYYRSTTSTVLDSLADMQSVAMNVTRLPAVGALGSVEVSGTIPESVVDTRGVDYFFSVSDGSRTAWYPGTSAVDGPVATDGARIAFGHIRVREAPEIVPEQKVNAKQLKPLDITSTVTCATERCDVELYYAQAFTNLAPLSQARTYSKLAMRKVSDGPKTAAGTVGTYTATIPAADVTTKGVAWYVRAFDGYVQTFSPGLPYNGAYVPTGNLRPGAIQLWQHFPTLQVTPTAGGTPVGADQNRVVNTGLDLAWLTRVVDPPHIVHAPVGTVPPDRQVPIAAQTTCVTAACTAKLFWRDRFGKEQVVAMKAERSSASVPETPQTDRQDIWNLTAFIPRRDVIDGAAPNYRIIASDGYTEDTTPTYPVVVSDKNLASIGGRVNVGANRDLFVGSDDPLAGISLSAKAIANGQVLPVDLTSDRTDEDGRYTLSDLPAGEYEVAIDATSVPPGLYVAPGDLVKRIRVSGRQRVRDAHFTFKAEDRDGDGLADYLEPRYGLGPGTAKDTDSDRLIDGFEVKKLLPAFKPTDRDTDHDGIEDGDADPDLDELSNVDEQTQNLEPLNPDTDDDRLRDGFEVHKLAPDTKPNVADTDGDGTPDGTEDTDTDDLENVLEQQSKTNPKNADTDGDGLRDGFETKRTSPFALPLNAQTKAGVDDGTADIDGDGLTNRVEQDKATDPLAADGDNDRLSDKGEIAARTDPSNPDTDDDGLSDATEVNGTTNPKLKDTDGDGLIDSKETTSSTVKSGSVSVQLTGTGDLAKDLQINAAGKLRTATSLGQLGSSYDIHLDDRADGTFEKASISLPYDPTKVSTPSNLRLFTLDEKSGAWLPSSTTQRVDTTSKRVIADVDHFSVYAVFEVENWRQKWTTTIDGCEGNPPNIDLSLAFDVGNATRESDPGFALSKETARRFVAALGAQDRGAVSETDDSYRIVQGLTADQAALNAGIADVHSYGRPTDLEQVINGGLAPLRSGGPRQLHRARVMILFSAGRSLYDYGPSLDVANAGNVSIYTVGVGDNINREGLEAISGSTGGKFFQVRTADDLPKVLARVSRQASRADFDNDGLWDCDEANGLIDSATGQLFFSDPTLVDTDGDEIPDGDEAGPRANTADIERYGTNLGAQVGEMPVFNVVSDPKRTDTDGDTFSDFDELTAESDARSADHDNDGLSDQTERDLGLDSDDRDTDGDSIPDGKEADGTSDGLHPAIPNETHSKFSYARDFGLGALCGTDTPFCNKGTVPFFMGSLASGFAAIGDIRDLIVSLVKGDVAGAGLSLGSIIPVFGDGANASVKTAKFVEEHPDKAADVVRAISGVETLTKAKKLEKITDAIGTATFQRLRTRINEDDLLKFADAGMDLKVLDTAIENAAEVPTKRVGFTSNWRQRETELRDEKGAVIQKGKRFRTSRGYRVVDAFTGKCIYEAKNGLQSGRKLFKQMAKDRELTALGNNFQLEQGCLEWHFYPSSGGIRGGNKHTLGMSETLLRGKRDGEGKVLEPGLLGDPENGIPAIKYVIHLP